VCVGTGCSFYFDTLGWYIRISQFGTSHFGYGGPEGGGNGTATYALQPSNVPVPGVLALLGIGLAGLAVGRRTQ